MKDYIYLKYKDTINKGFEKLKGKFGGIIFIIDNNKKLLGTVSEGDLRRSILKGNPADTQIGNVMNRNPTFVYSNELKSKFLKRSDINLGKALDRPLVIPVVDKNKKLLSIISSEEFINLFTQKKSIFKKKIKQKKPHTLIVGGAGYIGSVLTAKLLNKNYKIKVVDKMLYEKNSLKKFTKKKNFSLIKKDICDPEVQINVLKDIDTVIFLAEIVGDPSCAAKPEDALKTNYLALSSMANLCSYMNISRFVYTSSCSVYGAHQGQKTLLDEKSPLNPVSHYARMKIMSEKALLSQSNFFFSPTILRLATVYGPSFRNRFDLVVNIFAKDAFFKKKVNVNGGEQWRPNIHVEDVADAIIRIIESPIEKVEKQIFNLSNPNENFKIKQLAEKAKKVFKNCNIKITKKKSDNRDYKVSSRKIEQTLNFKATKSVESALKKFNNLFKNKKIKNINLKKYSNYESLIDEK